MGGGKAKGGRMVWVPTSVAKNFVKGKGKGKAGAVTTIRNVDIEKKVWLSGLPEGTEKGPKRDKLNKELQKYLTQKGIKCIIADVWKNGNGAAAFASKKDAKKAIEELSGTTFKDS